MTDDGAANDLPWGSFTDRSVHVVDVAGLDPLAQDLVFARVVSKLREHLERRELGVDHVVVFVDELNKYAPADGPDTYVRKMLLDLSERGRYLGLVLFSAQQFRSQVQRRVVGNAGTGVYGRMDLDELATPGIRTLSPATKIKLATLPKGELMVRHPHFTQPIFVKFPRPAVLGEPRGHRAVSARGRAAVRRCGGAAAPGARPRDSRSTRSGRWSRPARGGCAARPRRHPARAAGRRARLLHGLSRPPGEQRGGDGSPRRARGQARRTTGTVSRRAIRVSSQHPAHLAPEQPGPAGDPSGFANLVFLAQILPRLRDAFPAEVAEQLGRVLPLDDRQSPDAVADHLVHGFLEHLIRDTRRSAASCRPPARSASGRSVAPWPLTTSPRGDQPGQRALAVHDRPGVVRREHRIVRGQSGEQGLHGHVGRERRERPAA